MENDVIVEVSKNIDQIVEVEKFNPYHDAKGRFASAGAGGKFYATPGKSKAQDKAIDREKIKDNPNRHMKTSELETKANDISTKMQRALTYARMGTNHSSPAVRRKAQQGQRDYEKLKAELKQVHDMMDYNSKWGNANDKNPF